MLRLVMSPGLTAVVDVIAWGVVHAGTGYAAHRLPANRLSDDGWLLQPRGFEDGGRWYRRRLAIHRWKDTLPEAGAMFPGGISKRHLPTHDSAGLELFAREARRAELGHWWALLCGPLFVLWNPALASVLLVVYGVAANLPFIVIQRYNRFRALSLVGRRRERTVSWPPGATGAPPGRAC